MSRRLDPKGLQGAFARRRAPAGGLDFLVPARPAEPAPQETTTPAPEVASTAPGVHPFPARPAPGVPPLPEPPPLQRLVLRPAERLLGAWLRWWREVPKYMTGR